MRDAEARWRRWGTAASVVVLTLGLLGCASSRTPRPMGMETDDWISSEIRRLLVQDERVEAGGISIESRDGVVVLAGIAGSLDEVRRALRIAGRVDGVVQVVNRLRVVPRAGGASA